MTSDAFRHPLGARVKDRVTGLIGIVLSRAEHLFGCARYWVQPQELKDGKPVDGMWIDEDALEVIEVGVIRAQRYRVVESEAVAEPLRRAGGPVSMPSSTSRRSET
mgnify:CR=1 FL=1